MVADPKVGEETTIVTPVTTTVTSTNVSLGVTGNPDDPYDAADERAECNDFIFNTFFSWTGAGGTFSTWRERHVFLNGLYDGFKYGVKENFDAVPAMWGDERQYYEFGQEAGYVLRHALIYGFTGAVSSGVLINLGTILTLIKPILGM